MTQEQQSTEPTIRGLQDSMGGPNTPLRKFIGLLDSYAPPNEKGRIVFGITDIEVLHSIDVYPWPSATIDIKYSNRTGSAWGIFSASLDGCIPKDEDLAQQVGKRVGFEWTDGHNLGFKDNKWTPSTDDEGNELPNQTRPDVIIAAWEVFQVEGNVRGAANITVDDKLAELLDGKTAPEFAKAALADPMVKAIGPEAARKITSKSFIKEALASGLFTVGEDGIHHKA